jgi:hypothetical protein
VHTVRMTETFVNGENRKSVGDLLFGSSKYRLQPCIENIIASMTASVNE